MKGTKGRFHAFTGNGKTRPYGGILNITLMEIYKKFFRESLTSPDDIARAFSLDAAAIATVVKQYPALINPYFHRIIGHKGGPIYCQVVPDPKELSAANLAFEEDPIGEDTCCPVTNLSHIYPDRVLFLISARCPVHCRFCTRKRKLGRGLVVTRETVDRGIEYISSHPEVRDVLLSGGDPLMLSDVRLNEILGRIRDIEHVEIIRIGSRVPCALPQRVTHRLAWILSRFQPLYIHTHFNHPAEITDNSTAACRILADAGIPMGNQTVLLKDINDDPDVLETLFRSLLTLRIRPYYLFQVDHVRGARHFRTPIERGLQIMDTLQQRTSPMALPRFAVDLPGARGKVLLSEGNIVKVAEGQYKITTLSGEAVPYSDPD